jgi:ketosteroid isomerase-like protein
MAASERERQQIADVVEQYRVGWARMDVERLKAIWDQDYDAILYIPAEAAQPIREWAGVEDYFQQVAGFFARVKTMQLTDLAVDVFGEVAYAFCNFHFEADVDFQSEPWGVNGRNTFILRRKADGWRVIHYHESRPYLPEARGEPLRQGAPR